MGASMRLGRFVASGSLTALVMASLVYVPAAATEPAVECVGAADDPARAVEVAASCGSEVEVASARTPWETVFATPTGGTRVEISSTAVRTDVNGAWEPIDTSLVLGESGIEVAAPALPIMFSDGTAGMPLATIHSDGHALEFRAPFELTAPVIEGDRVTYPEVLPGVDLIASVDEDGSGFSEVLRVASPEAAAHPALAELEFPVTVSDGLTVSESEGGFVATDTAGDEVFSSPTPLMWDSGSAGVPDSSTAAMRSFSVKEELDSPAPGDVVDPVMGEPAGEPVEAPALDSTVAAIPVEVSDGAVTLTPDAELIADPGTSWPVYIDPSVGRDPVEWTAIREGMSSDYKFSGDQGVGFCDVSEKSECGRDFTSRLVWEFHDLGPIAELAAGDIVYGHFTAYGTHSFECTDYSVQAFRVENIASGTTWDSNSGWTDSTRYLSSRSVHHKTGCPSGPGRITWDVTDAAKYTATNGGYLTIGLKAATETTMSRWKRYRNDATLSVAFNRAPSVPSGRHTVVEDGDYACSAESGTDSIRSLTPTLKATASDPDGEYGQKVQVRFQVIDDATGTEVWESALTTAQASGQEHAVKVPSGRLSDEKVYRWRVQVQDDTVDPANSRVSGWTGYCYIRPDMTPPNKPTVTSTAYPAGQTSGGIDVAGTFSLGPNGSTDVEKYAYSFNSDALDCRIIDSKKCLAGSSVSVPFTPSSGGSVVLYVQSFDKAGRGSPVNVYMFGVAYPHVSAYWHLDEGGKDSAEGGMHPLSISASTNVVNGPRVPFGVAADRALAFDAGSDSASTSGSVVDTARSFSVTAFVNPKAADAVTQVAVSQDGNVTSGFKLGRLGSGCPNGMTTCFGFWKAKSDQTSTTSTIVASDNPVAADRWTHLTGVYDASTKKMSLYVCSVGTIDEPASPVPVLEQQATYDGTAWTADGPVQLGRGLVGGSYQENWAGQIDDVRLYNVALPVTTIGNICSGDET